MSVNQNDLKEGRINDQIGSQLESMSAQVEEKVKRGKNALQEWFDRLPDKSAELGRTFDRYSQEHPWRIASCALLTGLVLGRLLFDGKASNRRMV